MTNRHEACFFDNSSMKMVVCNDLYYFSWGSPLANTPLNWVYVSVFPQPRPHRFVGGGMKRIRRSWGLHIMAGEVTSWSRDISYKRTGISTNRENKNRMKSRFSHLISCGLFIFTGFSPASFYWQLVTCSSYSLHWRPAKICRNRFAKMFDYREF